MLFILKVAAGIAVVGAEVVRVRLHKNPVSFKEASRSIHQSSVNNVHGRWRMGGGDSPHAILINDYMNAQYYGEMEVGTPGQKQRMLFDTGSSNVWVSRTWVPGHYYFKSRTSSTYEPNKTEFTIHYGSGPVYGNFMSDKLSFAGLPMESFIMAEVNPWYLQGYLFARFDGIVGLGFDSISVGNAPTVMSVLVGNKMLDEPVFAFYLGNHGPGELIFGGTDAAHYTGDFHYVPLSKTTYWEVALEGMSVGSASVSNATRAIVDSGTSLLAGPSKEVAALMKQFGAVSLWGREYIVNCLGNYPDLVITLGGKEFRLTLKDLIFIKASPVECLLGIQGFDMPSSQEPMWILGDVFMRKYYTKFDWGRQRLGFAEAVKAEPSVTTDNLIVA